MAIVYHRVQKRAPVIFFGITQTLTSDNYFSEISQQCSWPRTPVNSKNKCTL